MWRIYCLGVVPYEMSDSFPLEALKAQAVAARTYALRSQNPTQPYDLVDTTNDQVYRGYVPGNDRTERAIRETRGVCGFYRDQLAQCYYSASNGGQTELVWKPCGLQMRISAIMPLATTPTTWPTLTAWCAPLK